MFNEIQKQQYINNLLEKTNIENKEKFEISMTQFFDKFSHIEEELDQDFCECDYDTMMLILNLVCRGSVAYNESILSHLRQYCDWCIINGRTKSAENLMQGITVESLNIASNYRLSHIKNSHQLIEYLDIGYKNIQEDTLDNLYRVYCLLLYSGIPSEEATELKTEAFDYENGTITYNENIIILEKDIYDVIKYYVDMTGFMRVLGRGESKLCDRANTGHFLENLSTNRKYMKIYCMSSVSKLNNALQNETQQKIQLNSTNIFLSGIYSRMYQIELSTGRIDSSEYMNYFNDKYKHKFKDKDFVRKTKLASKRLLMQYDCWKRAFDF